MAFWLNEANCVEVERFLLGEDKHRLNTHLITHSNCEISAVMSPILTSYSILSLKVVGPLKVCHSESTIGKMSIYSYFLGQCFDTHADLIALLDVVYNYNLDLAKPGCLKPD